MENILLTVPEFLRVYRISRTSFYDEVRKGRVKVIKRGRRTLIAKDDADAWLQALRQSNGGGVA